MNPTVNDIPICNGNIIIYDENNVSTKIAFPNFQYDQCVSKMFDELENFKDVEKRLFATIILESINKNVVFTCHFKIENRQIYCYESNLQYKPISEYYRLYVLNQFLIYYLSTTN